MITIQKVTPGMFEDILPLLVELENPRMSEDDWRRMLFHYAWAAEGEDRGYALLDGAKPIGFIGTLFSEREIAGRRERFCHLSSWIVSASHRARSLSLLLPVLRLKDHTLVSTTPSLVVTRLLDKLGFQVLEDQILVLPPLATPRELTALAGASVTTDPEDVRAALSGADLRSFDDHRSLGAHILLRRGERRCWAMATPMHKRHCRFAFLQHVSDRDLFWECLPLAKWGFLKALRAPVLAVDARFVRGRRPLALSRRLSFPRLYRPAHGGLEPAVVDGLYSELVALRM